ncbi:hypothetical protein ACFV6B_04330 [Streptomyces microflavus]|uniref:hypothetical protein n=1 Tax=Streptomyces microflavus TaxID=1919 RepID=UPI0036515B7B
MREAIIATLEREGRNPNSYNVAGIMRDAFCDLGPEYGYRAESEEKWHQAVEAHRRPFGVGDLVRVVVTTKSETDEHHYGRITQFRKANGGFYRGRPVKPHSAYVELDHHHKSGWLGPLTEVSLARDDFEIVREWGEIHRGALNGDWFRCLRCGAGSYKGAEVMIVHKVSGQRIRLCAACFNDDEVAALGHQVMFHGRNGQQTVAELTENPELITGSAGDSPYAKTDGEIYREWADCFPWLVPAAAAELYAQWREQQGVTR